MAKLRKTVERAKKHDGQSLKKGKKQTRKASATRRSLADHPTLTVTSLGAPSSHYDPHSITNLTENITSSSSDISHVNCINRSRRIGHRADTIQFDIDVAKSLRDECALKMFNRGHGTILTFEDKIQVLRMITNLRLSDDTKHRTEIHATVASCLQMSHTTVDIVWKEYVDLIFSDEGATIFDLALTTKNYRGAASKTYSYDHAKLPKEVLNSLHEITLNNLKIKKLMSYSDLARDCLEIHGLQISPSGLRKAMIRDFGYLYHSFKHESKSPNALQFKIRQFLARYAGTLLFHGIELIIINHL